MPILVMEMLRLIETSHQADKQHSQTLIITLWPQNYALEPSAGLSFTRKLSKQQQPITMTASGQRVWETCLEGCFDII